MIYYITYSNEAYKKTREFSIKMARILGGFDKAIGYDSKDIDEEFRRRNKRILLNRVGNGLWLWKPYFLNRKLKEVNEGDIVFYCDAGSFFIRNCECIINNMKEIWVSDIPLIEKQFTKPELFEYMDCKEDCYYETNQIQANFIAVRKTKESLGFVEKWLEYCCIWENMNGESNKEEEKNRNAFISHRYDQSVLSLLCKKRRIETHLDPTQYGKVPEKYFAEGRIFSIPKHDKEYYPCIILHRTAEVNIETCFRQWMCTVLPKNVIRKISIPAKQIERRRENNIMEYDLE